MNLVGVDLDDLVKKLLSQLVVCKQWGFDAPAKPSRCPNGISWSPYGDMLLPALYDIPTAYKIMGIFLAEHINEPEYFAIIVEYALAVHTLCEDSKIDRAFANGIVSALYLYRKWREENNKEMSDFVAEQAQSTLVFMSFPASEEPMA